MHRVAQISALLARNVEKNVRKNGAVVESLVADGGVSTNFRKIAGVTFRFGARDAKTLRAWRREVTSVCNKNDKSSARQFTREKS